MKTRDFTTREVISILEQNGYYLVRKTKGSHMIYTNGKSTIAIPVQHKSVNRMLFARLVKQNNLNIKGE